MPHNIQRTTYNVLEGGLKCLIQTIYFELRWRDEPDGRRGAFHWKLDDCNGVSARSAVEGFRIHGDCLHIGGVAHRAPEVGATFAELGAVENVTHIFMFPAELVGGREERDGRQATVSTTTLELGFDERTKIGLFTPFGVVALPVELAFQQGIC